MRPHRSTATLVPALTAAILVCLFGNPCLAEADSRIGVGAGIVRGGFDADRGSLEDYTGFYGVMLGQFKNGVMGRLALSFGDFSGSSETGTIDMGTLRLDLSAGYMFRRAKSVRPFVHGGLALLSVNKSNAGTSPMVEDDTIGFTLGAGLVAMWGRHGLYADICYDSGVSVDTYSAGKFDFNMTEVHLGFIWMSN